MTFEPAPDYLTRKKIQNKKLERAAAAEPELPNLWDELGCGRCMTDLLTTHDDRRLMNLPLLAARVVREITLPNSRPLWQMLTHAEYDWLDMFIANRRNALTPSLHKHLVDKHNSLLVSRRAWATRNPQDVDRYELQMAEILARLVYSQEDRVLHDVLQELEDLVSLLATPGLEEASRKELYREVGRVVSWHQPNPFLPKLPRRVLARWGYTGAFPVRRLLNENPELHYNIVASVGSLTRVRMTLPAPDVTGQWFTRVTTGPSTPPDAKSNCIWCDIQLRTMGYVMEEEQ